jgi:hypothetical protein
MNHQGFGQGAFGTGQRRVVRRKASNKNVAVWIALGLLYFFYPHIAVLIFVGMFYVGKIQVAFKWKQILMPALACLALATFRYPQAYMALRATTFVLFILYFLGRFRFRMK